MSRACFLSLCLFSLALGTANSQTIDGVVLVRAELVSATTAVEPGRPFQIGLRLKMAPHWHTYWRYSGDAGLPTKIEWKLPEGFSAGPIEWPVPQRLTDPGGIVTYGYSDEVVLFSTITPPPKLHANEVTLRAVAKWLVCAEICVPGKAEDLKVTLPVGPAASAATDLLEPYRKALPRPETPFRASWQRSPAAFHLSVTGDLPDGKWEFFPVPSAGLQIEHPAVERSADKIAVTVPVLPETNGSVAGVLAVENAQGRIGWRIASSSPPGASASPQEEKQPAAGLTLSKALLFGLLGGLILNLMPCVLPVIALKIFGFIKQAGQSRARARLLGLSFVGGVFAWFLGLALLIALLRLAGRDLNWAFQFQQPAFVLGMMALLFVFALNLLGVFEIYLPGQVNLTLSGAASREGPAGAFLHGVLATLLATPCTAPFLGPALGFAFSQNILTVFAIFLAIAFGMSLPYLLLAFQPGWIRFLPKPGAWMERVKQAMGFLLMGTVIFLLWVAGRQRGVDGMALAVTMLLMLGVAGWIFGGLHRAGRKVRLLSGLVLLCFLGLGAWFFQQAVQANAPERTGDGSAWQPFSTEALAQARASGRPVFLDFTADWCVNCKWNERFVLETAAVRSAFKAHDVILMRADWTNGDPVITGLLKSFGRAGVPVYVLYPAGTDSAPLVLPEILTQEGLLESLENLGSGTSG